MEFDIESAARFVYCLLEQRMTLICAGERLERVCKALEKSDEQKAVRARRLFDSLSESITAAGKLASAIRRISGNYSGCENCIEERYDSLWCIEKGNTPALLELSVMEENMKDISFV